VEERGGLSTGGWLEKDTAESAEGQIFGREQPIEFRFPAPKRHRFGGEYPYRTWPQEIDLEVPLASYAPPQNPAKPWPRKAQMESWFPPTGENTSFRPHGATRPRNLESEDVLRSLLLLRAHPGTRRSRLEALQWKRERDAGAQNLRRTEEIFLALLPYGTSDKEGTGKSRGEGGDTGGFCHVVAEALEALRSNGETQHILPSSRRRAGAASAGRGRPTAKSAW
jgi:hypothetical protein